MMNDDLYSRRLWFDLYMHQVEKGEADMPQVGRRYTCPCCGYPTLEIRNHYEVCSLCSWEDDGQDDADAGRVLGGPNRSYSLLEARDNFSKYFVMYSPDKPTTSIIGNENTATQMREKRAIVKAFNSMINETDEGVLKDLWQRVHEGEKALEIELYRIVGEY